MWAKELEALCYSVLLFTDPHLDYVIYMILCRYIWPSAPTVAPSGLGGGGGDSNELIVTWTVSG